MKKSRSLCLTAMLAAFALAAGLAGASPYSTLISGDGAIGYWRLGDASGATTAANSGSAAALLNGSYSPPKVAAGGLILSDPDTAAGFDGSSTHVYGAGISTANGGSSVFANDWTIEGWLVRDSVTPWGGVFSNNRFGSSAPLMTWLDSSSRLGINGAGVTANNVSVDLGQLTGTQQYLGKRVYAMITKTGGNAANTANLTVTVNVGGVWLGPATGTNNGWTLSPQDGFYIGRHYDSMMQIHDGTIDEVAIYAGALSQSQMLNHYYAGAGGPGHYAKRILADNPVGFWRLGEAAGSNTAANVGTALGLLNGTINNFPTGVLGVPGLIPSTPGNTAADFNGVQSASGSYASGAGLNSVAGGNPFTNDWTIEAWFVHDSTQSWSGIFSNAVAAGGPLMTFIGSANLLGINGPGVTANNVSVDLGSGHFGQPIYAVITKTGGNANGTANLTVYANVDGTWLVQTGTNNGWNLTPQDGFYIGRHWGGNFLMHDGVIDEVALYSYALTWDQIRTHYAVRVPEPATLALVAGGCLALVRRRRRRK